MSKFLGVKESDEPLRALHLIPSRGPGDCCLSLEAPVTLTHSPTGQGHGRSGSQASSRSAGEDLSPPLQASGAPTLQPCQIGESHEKQFLSFIYFFSIASGSSEVNFLLGLSFTIPEVFAKDL